MTKNSKILIIVVFGMTAMWVFGCVFGYILRG